MRILHIGSGFRPWRRGGLVAYAEDLMDAQAARGHEVTYFFSGRQYPLGRAPRLRRWRRRGIQMLEVIDSPLHDHGRQPVLELGEPRVEALLQRALAATLPDVCHVQELAGLPSSVLEVLHARGIPTVMTLQDYFALCPTFKLLDADGAICLRHEVGDACRRTTRAEARAPGVLVDASVRLAVERVAGTRLPGVGLAGGAAGALEARRRSRGVPAPTAEDFQRRRDVNLARLNRVDALVAMSTRVAEIHAELGVSPERLRTIHLTLRHIEHLTPRRLPRSTGRPLTFATLAGLESVPKGAALIIDAARRLSAAAQAGRFEVLVLGHVDREIAARAQELPGIRIRGPYRPGELDTLLDEVDVGLIPSVWEEAYGYAGIEFLAKGIPVIANAIGGVTDYVRGGETGWLNTARSGAGLAEIMARLIEAPEEVAALRQRVVDRRAAIVTTHAAHVSEIEAVYRELVSSRA